jgi:hypothetical protein
MKKQNPQPVKTRILQKTFLTLTAGFAIALAPMTTHAQSLRAFQARLDTSTITLVGCNGDVCNYVFEGTGSANIMGRVTWTANVVRDYSGYPCNTATSEFTLVGATGSITVSETCGIVCPAATHFGFPYSGSAVWNVTGGTGDFSGIVGSGSTQSIDSTPEPSGSLSGIVVY